MCAYRQHLILFGGSAPGQEFGDLWTYDTLEGPDHSDQWCKQEFTEQRGVFSWSGRKSTPRKRAGHSCTVVGNHMYLFGGNTATKTMSDDDIMWALCLDNLGQEHKGQEEEGDAEDDEEDDQQLEWIRLQPANPPSPRVGHSATAIGHRIFIIGGRDFISRNFSKSAHVFDTVGCHFTELLITDGAGGVVQERLLARTGHAALAHQNEILVLGGLTNDGTANVYLSDLVVVKLF